MPPSLAVFDFDGTLADSLLTAIGIFNQLAAELGYRPIEDVSAAQAMTTRQFLRHHGISLWRLPRLVRRYHAAAAERAETIRVFPELPNALETLRTAGVRLGVLSSNREDNIRRCLRANGVEELFSFVVGYPKLFGKAKALQRILRTEQVNRSDAVYIGDEVRDIEAARKADVASIAVTWGFHSESLLRENQPDQLVTEIAAIAGVVLEARSES